MRRNFSELEFLPNKTFIYKYRTSVSCFLWYDTKGEWSADKNKLILTDYVQGSNQKHINDTSFTSQMIFRKSIFTINGDSLLLSEQTFDKFKPDYYPVRYLVGNYVYKE